jgi:hypothetical protein
VPVLAGLSPDFNNLAVSGHAKAAADSWAAIQ